MSDAIFGRGMKLSLGVALTFLLAPAVATADELHDCAKSYEQTQRLQQRNELMSALEAAEQCARPTCPALLTTECTKWEGEIRKKLPALVLRVRGADGCALTQAGVAVDGPTRKGEGSALLVEPGQHTITVTNPATNESKKESMNFAVGERRDIDIAFGKGDAVCPHPAKPPSIFERIPTVSLVAAGAGAGLFVLGAGLGIIGAVKRGDLDECKPGCSPDRIDGVQPFFTAGDILGAVGLVGIAVGVVTYFVLQPKTTTSGLAFTPAGVRF